MGTQDQGDSGKGEPIIEKWADPATETLVEGPGGTKILVRSVVDHTAIWGPGEKGGVPRLQQVAADEHPDHGLGAKDLAATAAARNPSGGHSA